MQTKRSRAPEYVLLFSVVFLILALIACYLFDVMNIFGITDRLLSADLEAPFLWFHLFNQGGLIEILQWLILAACVLTCGVAFGLERGTMNAKRAPFFVFLGIGMCLMLLEDAGDIRFEFAYYARFFFQQGESGRYAGKIMEFAVYGLLAGLMLYPLLRYWRVLKLKFKALFYLGAGYFFYAVSSISSASSGFRDWYSRAGGAIIEALPLRNRAAWESTSSVLEEQGLDTLGFYFMDQVFEESLEVLGAAFLLAFLLYIVNTALAKTQKSEALGE